MSLSAHVSLSARVSLNARVSAMHVAAQEGHSDVVATLLEQQNMACLDAVDDRGRTPLMYAAAAGKSNSVCR